MLAFKNQVENPRNEIKHQQVQKTGGTTANIAEIHLQTQQLILKNNALQPPALEWKNSTAGRGALASLLGAFVRADIRKHVYMFIHITPAHL